MGKRLIKILLATSVAVVAMLVFMVIGSAATQTDTTELQRFTYNVVPIGTEQKVVSESNVEGVRCFTELNLTSSFAYYQGSKQYILGYATLPTSKVCIGSNFAPYYKGTNSNGDVYEDTRYFDVLIASSQETTEGPQRLYLRTYISQYGGGGTESPRNFGYRISYRLTYEGQLTQPLNITEYRERKGTYTFDDGVKINYDYTIMPYSTESNHVSYMLGYTDAMEQMDLSGLTPTQTAFGAISAPINAVANVVQKAVSGWLYNPVGQVISVIIGIFVLGIAVYAIIKVVV